MRTFLVALTQIVCFLLTLVLGKSLPMLLRSLDVITNVAFYFAVSNCRFVYLLFSFGLLILSFSILIIGGESQENRIVAPPLSFGGMLIRLWVLQNTIFAVTSVFSYAGLVLLSPPEFRRFLLDFRFLWM
jgi:hypothetical protein